MLIARERITEALNKSIEMLAQLTAPSSASGTPCSAGGLAVRLGETRFMRSVNRSSPLAIGGLQSARSYGHSWRARRAE